jgi:hypothetical protein
MLPGSRGAERVHPNVVLPALTGFTTTFAMAAVFLAGCAAVALLIPSPALAAN